MTIILLGSAIAVASTCKAGCTVNILQTNLTEATDDHYNGLVIIFTSGNLIGQASIITDYTGLTKEVTLNPDLTESPANTDAFVILSEGAGKLVAKTKGLDAIYDLVNGVDAIIDNIHDTDLPAVKTVVDDIHTNTSALLTQLPLLVSHMDFWADNNAEEAIDTTATTDINQNSVTVAGIPASATIIRVVAMLKIALIKTSSGADNAVNGNTALKVDADQAYGSLVTAIDITDNSWAVDFSEATERGGDVLVGDNDIKTEVTGNATYYGQLTNIRCDGNFLLLKDVSWGLRIYFTV